MTLQKHNNKVICSSIKIEDIKELNSLPYDNLEIIITDELPHMSIWGCLLLLRKVKNIIVKANKADFGIVSEYAKYITCIFL